MRHRPSPDWAIFPGPLYFLRFFHLLLRGLGLGATHRATAFLLGSLDSGQLPQVWMLPGKEIGLTPWEDEDFPAFHPVCCSLEEGPSLKMNSNILVFITIEIHIQYRARDRQSIQNMHLSAGPGHTPHLLSAAATRKAFEALVLHKLWWIPLGPHSLERLMPSHFWQVLWAFPIPETVYL